MPGPRDKTVYKANKGKAKSARAPGRTVRMYCDVKPLTQQKLGRFMTDPTIPKEEDDMKPEDDMRLILPLTPRGAPLTKSHAEAMGRLNAFFTKHKRSEEENDSQLQVVSLQQPVQPAPQQQQPQQQPHATAPQAPTTTTTVVVSRSSSPQTQDQDGVVVVVAVQSTN